MNKTILYETHISLGAKMAPFANYLMPISYSGILREHEACRHSTVIFDTCHMGEIIICGISAESTLEKLLTCRVSSLSPGRCRYSLMCNEKGGVIDDLILYRLGPASFMLVVNSATRKRDLEWVEGHATRGTQVEDATPRLAKIDVQGPTSRQITSAILGCSLKKLRFYGFEETVWRGSRIIISRTGYTGELGFEIYFCDKPGDVMEFWNKALAVGVVPAGLGARDTLRLEMGFPLYGHELSETRNAADSTLWKAIDMTKQFIGKEALSKGGQQKLAGIQLDGRSSARQGDFVETPSGMPLGIVTSGSFAPSLGCAVALAYVKSDSSNIGTRVNISGARQKLSGQIVELPFYRHGTAKSTPGTEPSSTQRVGE